MLCKLCETPIAEGRRVCPNCGNVAPVLGLGDTSARNSPSPPAALGPATPLLDPNESTGASLAAVPVPAPRLGVPSALAGVPSALEAEPASSPLLPPLAQLRRFLFDHPALLEPGLGLLSDEKGDPVPSPYPTAVGDIDLIAQGEDGALVVVMIVPPGAGEGIVPEVLQRIGWVKRNLARGQRPVRGVVVLETPLERFGYSASALAGTVSFKLCRMTMSFQDVSP